MLLENFVRGDSPSLIRVKGVSGIDPNSPLDRAGTDDTNLTDVGLPRYADCSTFDPSTPAAQVWGLRVCHDVFFGNSSATLGMDAALYGPVGAYGPQRRQMNSAEVTATEGNYRFYVNCPWQLLRDFLLTERACSELLSIGLECYHTTSQRVGCTTWDADGNSCEPYPLPNKNAFFFMFRRMMQMDNIDPYSGRPYFDEVAERVHVDNALEDDPMADSSVVKDFSCREFADTSFGVTTRTVLRAISFEVKTQARFSQPYQEGLDLYEDWDHWWEAVMAVSPPEMRSSYQTTIGGLTGPWGFYFLNESLINEVFSGIGLSLFLCFVILSFATQNPIMSAIVVVTIMLIVVDVFAFTVLVGYK